MRPLRAVELPGDVVGRLYLHSMPGRYEPLGDCWNAVAHAGCSMIVCFAPSDEIQKKSPSYAAAIKSKTSPVGVQSFPIPDYAPPEDIDAFAKSVTETAGALKHGTSVLVHCGAGIGRTGTYAIGILMALGLSLSEAQRCVSRAPNAFNNKRHFREWRRSSAPENRRIHSHHERVYHAARRRQHSDFP